MNKCINSDVLCGSLLTNSCIILWFLRPCGMWMAFHMSIGVVHVCVLCKLRLSVMEWFVMGQPEEKDPIWPGFSPLAGNSVSSGQCLFWLSPFPCLTQNQHFSTPVWLFERLPMCPLPTSTFQPFLYSCPLHQKTNVFSLFCCQLFLGAKANHGGQEKMVLAFRVIIHHFVQGPQIQISSTGMKSQEIIYCRMLSIFWKYPHWLSIQITRKEVIWREKHIKNKMPLFCIVPLNFSTMALVCG